MPGDNRISNLRDVDQTQNIENQKKAHKNSKTGFLGVRLMRKSFTARIQCGSTTHHLGTFSTPEEAHEVYKEAKRKLHLGSTL